MFDEDWDEVLAKYELGKQLGSGAFAVVKKVTEKATGNVYAMKVCSHRTSQWPSERLTD